MFDQFDIECVQELMRLVNKDDHYEGDDSQLSRWFSGDTAVSIAYIASIAIEFDRQTDLDSPVRKVIKDNLMDENMLVDLELSKEE